MALISAEMQNIIEERLIEIEDGEGVEILFALDAGPHAWGLESRDSTYDVRFIYKHSLKWYLNILPRQEIIKWPLAGADNYTGWDLRKTLTLMTKSNPILYEWLKSPIVYKKDEEAFNLLKSAADFYFSPSTQIAHYVHLAKTHQKELSLIDAVTLKKYLFALRPLLACQWIQEHKKAPPLQFDVLLECITNKEIFELVPELLAQLKSGQVILEKPIPLLNTFIVEQIECFENYNEKDQILDKPGNNLLDDLFCNLLNIDAEK